MLWQIRKGLIAGRAALDAPAGGASGTARQVAIYAPGPGLVYLNSGSTVRQAQLPGVAVTEGT